MDFLLYLIKDVSLIFGDISKKILRAVFKYKGHKIAIIFDRYRMPSIKDSEHALLSFSLSLGTSEIRTRNYHISGEEQIRLTDFSKELRNINSIPSSCSILLSPIDS